MLWIRTAPRESRRGLLSHGQRIWPCALGVGGIGPNKREGDGKTPPGVWALRQVLYRADRMRRPGTQLPLTPIQPDDGWCDAPTDRRYNRPVKLPYPASAERLWRDDGIYDLIVVLGYNDHPRVRGRGSAIFLHLARPEMTPTAGCIALREADLRQCLSTLSVPASVTILA